MIEPTGTERALAERILGQDATPELLSDTKHRVTRWDAGGRSIVTKRFTKEAAYRAELLAARHLGEAGFHATPAFLGCDDPVIATRFVPGVAFAERFDRLEADAASEAFLSAASAIGGFQAYGDAIPREELRDRTLQTIPGPRGFVHGDPLPHNLLIDPGGRVFLLDLEHSGWGHSLLDLAPISCVLERGNRAEMLRRYCAARDWDAAPLAAPYEATAAPGRASSWAGSRTIYGTGWPSTRPSSPERSRPGAGRASPRRSEPLQRE